MLKNVKIVAISSDNVLDRIKLCWGHLDNWKESQIVRKTQVWLEKANEVFKPTTFIAYVDGSVIGMIEFLPQDLLMRLGLCQCRRDAEHGETEERYFSGEGSENYLFISCLFVNKDHQGKGVGKALLKHFLESEVFKAYGNARVYVKERDKSWDSYVHWPAGSKEFYIKNGFVVGRTLDNPLGYILSYKSR